MPLAKNWHPRPRKIKKPLVAWIRKYGAKSYRNFLITHPRYVLQEWRKAWDVIQEGMWILEKEPEYYADPRVRPKRLNAVIFNFPGHVSFPLAILVAAFGLIFIKKNPLLFFASAHSFIVSLIAFHADYVEVSRHCQQASMTLKIAYLLSILSLYVAIKNGLLGKPTQPRENNGSVNKAAPKKTETIEK